MPRYDWHAVQQYYDAGHTYRECLSHFGFSSCAWTDAVRRGALKAKARQLTVLRYIESGKTRWQVRKRLLEEGLLHYACYECGISEWLGRPIALHLDHINGDGRDHRLENVRMLCANCHSQTDTFAARNLRRKRATQDRSVG